MLLDVGQKHFLRLVEDGMAKHDGWAPISEKVWPLMSKLPEDLVERESLPVGGRARLTVRGQAVRDYSY